MLTQTTEFVQTGEKHLKQKKRKSYQKNLVYGLTIVLSLVYILLGNRIAAGEGTYEGEASYGYYLKAEVTEILAEVENIDVLGDNDGYDVRFEAEILKGENKGKYVTATKTYDSFAETDGTNDIKLGDKVILYSDALTINQDWIFMAYSRSDILMILGVVFLALLIVFGHRKGINTIISLTFTVLAIFFVLVPAILSGQNIYLWSIITCVFMTVMTMLIINGADKKSIAAIVGCISGVAVSGILILILNKLVHLTGIINEESVFLISLNTDNPIDLRAIVFAAILIGAIGAIMDVAMSISSSLWEISEQMSYPEFGKLLKSGLSIGRDIMGTMANTLILAYIGSSLALVLLLVAYNTPMVYLFNREMIVVEVLQALIGSFGLLFTIPFTSLVAAKLYAPR